jgi:hypothetical protein
MVALTTWARHAGPNSDEGVKQLMAYLKDVSERYDLTIGGTGHFNKGKHEDFSDSVAGARAWVDAPRQSFLHFADQSAGDHQFVIATAKKPNLTPSP